ncbi:MAG: N-6 DNA methylase, partial [Euryarchaeota archaeon]|nr:N-6 DNA methylase [Euryarchaeota archaeon]
LLLAVKKDIDNGRFSDESHLTSDWARREVVAHCIYGVDLNLMAVELAKVGLWLTTISKEKPLSFLDHRLKQGNSLIGANLIDLPWYPDLKAKIKKRDDVVLQKFEDEVHRPFVDKIVQQLKTLSEIDDDTIEHINQKKALFEKLKENKQYLQIKSIADVYTAVYFGNETTEVNKNPKFAYNDLFWALKGDDKEWSRKTHKPWFKTAMEIARDKSFFHWELEFPELFFEGGAPKENPGWDAVVGNPPYVNVRNFSEIDIMYFGNNYRTAYYQYDLFALFIEKGLNVIKYEGYFGYIIPNAILISESFSKLRNLILEISDVNSIVDLKDNVFKEAVVPTIILTLKKERNEVNKHTNEVKLIYNIIDFQTKNYEVKKIPQKIFYDRQVFDINLNEIVNKLNDDVGNHFSKLGDLTTINKGICLGNTAILTHDLSKVKTDEKFKKFIRGTNILRYELNFSGEYILYDKSLLYSARDEDIFRAQEKIVIRETADKPIGMYDDCLFYDQNTVHNLRISNELEYKLKYILTILNSKIATYYYQTVVPDLRRVFNKIKIQDLVNLPIRRISFITPPDRRAALVEQAKALYTEGAPDSQKILDFVGVRLSAAPEESDVVHDLLAYLAERMIEMNKEKNGEIKSFLDFLNGEIGVSVEDLSNKTAIQEYYRHEFQNLIDVFAKNKKKLKARYDPKSPSNYKHLQQWYNDSTGKLKPLMGRIEATDGLIDAIVYKLYGLTEDEIKIVEESISGKGQETSGHDN